MRLSDLSKFEKKSLYPKDYKHLLDVIHRSPMMILDNSNGNCISIDERMCFRFNLYDKITTIEISPLQLFEVLKSMKSSNEGEFKYSLYGSGPDFENITLD